MAGRCTRQHVMGVSVHVTEPQTRATSIPDIIQMRRANYIIYPEQSPSPRTLLSTPNTASGNVGISVWMYHTLPIWGVGAFRRHSDTDVDAGISCKRFPTSTKAVHSIYWCELWVALAFDHGWFPAREDHSTPLSVSLVHLFQYDCRLPTSTKEDSLSATLFGPPPRTFQLFSASAINYVISHWPYVDDEL